MGELSYRTAMAEQELLNVTQPLNDVNEYFPSQDLQNYLFRENFDDLDMDFGYPGSQHYSSRARWTPSH
jgi:hypothetical protein